MITGIEGLGWMVPPGDAMRPFLRLAAEAAQALGGQVLAEPVRGRFGFFIDAAGRRHPIHGAALGLNGDAAARLAGDKDYTARLLAYAGLTVPDHVIVPSGASAAPGLAWAREECGFPLWVKPNDGHGGEGVTRVGDIDALTAAMAPLRAAGRNVLLQAEAPGRAFRLVVLEGRTVLAYERLAAAGAPGNLSRGGKAHAIRPGPEIAALAERAAAVLGLRWAGVDLIAEDMQAGPATVLEVNAAPGFDAYASAAPDHWAPAREAMAAALEALAR